VSGWLGDLGSMRGDRGSEERRTQEWSWSRGVKHWDKCKLATVLERVVFTSSRTARLEFNKALDAGKNWKCVLLCCIDPRVRKIRNGTSSCPGIFSRTLRFYNVASSPVISM